MLPLIAVNFLECFLLHCSGAEKEGVDSELPARYVNRNAAWSGIFSSEPWKNWFSLQHGCSVYEHWVKSVRDTVYWSLGLFFVPVN